MTDLEECKLTCIQENHGGFMISGGKCTFSQDPATLVFNSLVADAAAVTFINHLQVESAAAVTFINHLQVESVADAA